MELGRTCRDIHVLVDSGVALACIYLNYRTFDEKKSIVLESFFQEVRHSHISCKVLFLM